MSKDVDRLHCLRLYLIGHYLCRFRSRRLRLNFADYSADNDYVGLRTFLGDMMIELLLAVCATLAASFGGEVLREWVIVCQAFQQAATPQEDDWMAYYRNIKGFYFQPSESSRPIYVSPYMQWAVPNSLLSGPPCGPSSYPLPPMFPNFPHSTQ